MLQQSIKIRRILEWATQKSDTTHYTEETEASTKRKTDPEKMAWIWHRRSYIGIVCLLCVQWECN